MLVLPTTIYQRNDTPVLLKPSSSKALQTPPLKKERWIKNLKVKKRQSILAVGYTVNEDNKLEMVQDWEIMYGKLSRGEYRLIKSISIKKLNFAVRFSI